MDARTLQALRKSIAKWERNAEAETPEDVRLTVEDCPLCDLFYTGLGCIGCPVNAKSRKNFCLGTPYGEASKARAIWRYSCTDANRDAFRAAARKMADYLIALLPAGETK